MFNNKKVSVIICAGGRGKRFGGDTPKQLVRLPNGNTVLEETLTKFDAIREIDDIIVVTSSECQNETKALCESFEHKVKLTLGGKERQDSVRSGLELVSDDDGLILVHDSARPFVTIEIIKKVIEISERNGSAVPTVPVKDTIRQVVRDGNPFIPKGYISKTLDRASLYSVQTPQGFKANLLKQAYDKAYESGFYGTDDAMLVERLGVDITMVAGDYSNIKITTREDLPMTEKTRLSRNSEGFPPIRVGTGFDVHKFSEDRELWLCGVKIPYERGLLGHSDADVSIHALMDAMLGALSLGDIGKHFPDTDEKYKGISSVKLLKFVNELILSEGYTVGNLDITIMAQKPKILPYIDDMKCKIAETLHITKDRVSIKGTTTEKLGFVGREEGIASEAICTLYKI